MADRIRLIGLPVPPSPNRWPKHPQAQHQVFNRYKRRVWATALEQEVPSSDPPDKVAIDVCFRVHNWRDEDNLQASLKPLLDALRKGPFKWRQGIADAKGFFVDDDPGHLRIQTVTQTVDRKRKGVDVAITPI